MRALLSLVQYCSLRIRISYSESAGEIAKKNISYYFYAHIEPDCRVPVFAMLIFFHYSTVKGIRKLRMSDWEGSRLLGQYGGATCVIIIF